MNTKQAETPYIPPPIVQPPEVMANNDRHFRERWMQVTPQNLLTAFGLGAGAYGLSHLLGRLTASKPKKKHEQFSGSPVAADGGVKLAADPVPAPVVPPLLNDSNPVQLGLGVGVNTVGSVLAGIGGWAAMSKLVNARKKQERQAEIDAARDAYERELGVKVAALDALWANGATQKVAGNWGNIVEYLKSWAPGVSAPVSSDYGMASQAIRLPGINGLLGGYGMYAGVTGLAGAAAAAPFVYDLTKRKSNAGAIQKAREARARLSTLPPMWVTPDDIIALRDKNKQAPQMADAA